MVTKPNFLIIGAGKAGTTSVYHYLKQHPQVFMSTPKETCFFAFDDEAKSLLETHPDTSTFYTCKDEQHYLQLFEQAGNARAIGEASPQYIYTTSAPLRMATLLDDVRIIAILRNPIDRAFSSYLMYVRDGVEQRPFEQAIIHELNGYNNDLPYGWFHYLDRGCYGHMLKPYFAQFPRERIHIVLYDDLQSDNDQVMHDMFRFLDVDATFKPDTRVRHNVSGMPTNKMLHSFTGKNKITQSLKSHLPKSIREPLYRWAISKRSGNLQRPKIHPHTRRYLQQWYENDIRELENMINRDLNQWTTTSPILANSQNFLPDRPIEGRQAS